VEQVGLDDAHGDGEANAAALNPRAKANATGRYEKSFFIFRSSLCDGMRLNRENTRFTASAVTSHILGRGGNSLPEGGEQLAHLPRLNYLPDQEF
jgi:hypothetical protein